MISFTDLRVVNMKRLVRWHHEDRWTLADWSNAMCGEAGEAANIVKKLRRIETDTVGKADPPALELRTALGHELADVVIYADILAAKLRLDLGEMVREKFNIVSEREGFPERL